MDEGDDRMRPNTLCRVAAVVLSAAGVITGCSSAPQPGPAASSAPSGEPTAAAPAILPKQIGEKAGKACEAGPDGKCDLEFAVTRIVPDEQCAPRISKPPLGPDQQLIRFDVEFWTAPKFVDPRSPGALFLDNWAIEDSDGVIDMDLKTYINDEQCSDQILKFFPPDVRGKKSLVVIAPKNAAVLRLYQVGGGGGWEWKIPPVSAG